jgi:hypothetical protein
MQQNIDGAWVLKAEELHCALKEEVYFYNFKIKILGKDPSSILLAHFHLQIL